MQAAGRYVSDDDLVRAWVEDSDRFYAVRLALPEDDAVLLKILLEHLPSTARAISWETTLADAGDGSGDVIVRIPRTVLAELGIQMGDSLEVATADQRGLSLVKSRKPKRG